MGSKPYQRERGGQEARGLAVVTGIGVQERFARGLSTLSLELLMVLFTEQLACGQVCLQIRVSY